MKPSALANRVKNKINTQLNSKANYCNKKIDTRVKGYNQYHQRIYLQFYLCPNTMKISAQLLSIRSRGKGKHDSKY